MVSKIINFIKTDIWEVPSENLPRKRSFFIKLLKAVVLTLRRFNEDKCSLRASALTFYSLLSVVPVVALVFGVAKGFGFEKHLETQFLEKFPGHEEVVTQIIGFARSLLEETRGGMIFGTGMLTLFWLAIKLLSNIERSFNHIWRIEKSRSTGRKLSDYISIMLICPIFVIISSSFTVFMVTQITLITEKFAFLGVFSPFIFFIFKLIPYFAIWVVFAFIYIFMPNTKVNFLSGFVAGIIAGTIYQVVNGLYINFQIGVGQYNAIYGSFAALPLFLIWLQVSWIIVLFGAEISFLFQNMEEYEFEHDCLHVSPAFKKLLTLQTAHLVIKNFSCGHKHLTAREISNALSIPINLVRQIIHELIECGIISEIRAEKNKESEYQPACTINVLTVKYIIDAIEQRGVATLRVAQTKELETLSETLKAFNDRIENSPENKLLKDI